MSGSIMATLIFTNRSRVSALTRNSLYFSKLGTTCGKIAARRLPTLVQQSPVLLSTLTASLFSSWAPPAGASE